MSGHSSIGSKRAATLLSLECTHFKASHEGEKKLEEIANDHDRMVDLLIRYLKRLHPDISCVKEHRIQDQTLNLIGSIDLYCQDFGNRELLIYEVKSYYPSKSKLRDYYQLGLYVKAIRRKIKDLNVRGFLVYRFGKKNLLIIEVRGEEEFITVSPQLLNAENPVPGDYCKYCGNTDCPFNPAQWGAGD